VKEGILEQLEAVRFRLKHLPTSWLVEAGAVEEMREALLLSEDFLLSLLESLDKKEGAKP
jgi:hypothetical protein